MKKSTKIDLDEIIRCLGVVAATLQEDPERALRDLRKIGAKIDSHVPYRDGHSLRVTDYCLEIAEHLGFDENEKVVLEVAALLHDFGKIGIDENILLKPSTLNEYEKNEVEMHVMRGYYMLAGFNELIEALKGIKSHHEFYDGTGYPEGLSKGHIPLIGRIIAVADAYDAMTSERPYRDAMTRDEAITELRRVAGSQFDPAIVRIFIKHVKQKNTKKNNPALIPFESIKYLNSSILRRKNIT
jgi:HD-GYP domain-containing protein (c-di-GMP phosphodiesterase class II)